MLAELEGGWLKVLNLAGDSIEPYSVAAPEITFEKFLDDHEACILFMGLPQEKIRQISRAAVYWEHAVGVLDARGNTLPPKKQERAVSRIWPVLMAAGTITGTEAIRYHFADPVAEIICAYQGGSLRRCKANLIKE